MTEMAGSCSVPAIQATDERDGGFGEFWGGSSASLASGNSKSAASIATTLSKCGTRELSASQPARSRTLPPLHSERYQRRRSDVSIGSASLSQLPSIPNPPESMLGVLQTLVESIKSDTTRFMTATAGPPSDWIAASSSNSRRRYYSDGVLVEDREYFNRERTLDEDRDAFFAATTLARKRHCATDDKQRYLFDRASPSKKRGQAKRSDRPHTSKLDESAVIELHRRKIWHLVHVLQEEIANETRRSIKLVEYHPSRPVLSRQSKRALATIITERCEAADRIMRILEEYKIVIGVDAARYLQATVAAGKPRESRRGSVESRLKFSTIER